MLASPGAEWEVIWTNELGADGYVTPAIVDGKLYIRTDWGLYCFAEGAKGG